MRCALSAEMDDDDEELNVLLREWAQLIQLQRTTTARYAVGAQAAQNFVIASRRNSIQKKWKGRVKGSRTKRRGESTWIADYLGSNPIYNARDFRRRFRVPRVLFRKLCDDLLLYDESTWGRRRNAAGKFGACTEVKVMACLRYLGTGRSTDDIDDSARMSSESIRQYVRRFTTDIVAIHKGTYLSRPNQSELETIEKEYDDSGFPGCVGAVDCCCLYWKNCPLEEKGQYHNPKDSKLATVKVEAWCDSKLYIWHWFAGKTGTTNDKTMVSFSPLFQDIFSGKYAFKFGMPYHITSNSNSRTLPYFLVDGIYPRWPIFALPIHITDNIREQRYTKAQEGRRKDIERAFGVVQSRFRSLRVEDFRWNLEDIIVSSEACVITHNLLIRMNESGVFVGEADDEDEEFNMVTEMYDDDLRNAATRATERDEQERVVSEEDDALNATELVEEIFLRESELSSFSLHCSLKRDLIDKFSRS